MLEYRKFDADVFETRGDSIVFKGYASTTEQPYTMHDAFGEYQEIVKRGAFSQTLASNPSVVLLANHTGMPFARTDNGSLTLAEDAHGLFVTANLDKRSTPEQFIEAVRSGLMPEMSFAFRVLDQDWSQDYTTRYMFSLDLHKGDVSVVNFGANPNTSIVSLSQ